jgi:hypothetical protein
MKMNNNDKHLASFETWYQVFFENRKSEIINGREFDRFGGYGVKTIDPPKDEIIKICSLFDYFICSPNNLYFCETRQQEYPIGSKSLKCGTLGDLLEKINRFKGKYEKLFLHSLQIIDETQQYEVRFATFPYADYDKFDY